MKVLENISLKPFNTFGIDAQARFFCEVTSVEEVKKALQLRGYPELLILGGGSNMLITRNIDALVLYVNIKGRNIVKEDDETAIVKVMAGENWHQMVLWTLDLGFGGLENLSLIPGNTGTAPIQNIGAYGVELNDVFESCEAIEIDTRLLKTLNREACAFGYRDSYFKNDGRSKYIIISVSLKLTKNNHKQNIAYGDIQEELKNKGITYPTPKDISDAVIRIRQSKLPDPSQIGNSGSFFKNPVLDKNAFLHIYDSHPEIPFYKISDNAYKIPAGWLIEQCGFKGKRFGDAGVHEKQALVLVNYGNASGIEILDLAHRIIKEVQQNFQITLTPEVNIIK